MVEPQNVALTIRTRSAESIMASGFTAAQTSRTHDRTRPMLHKRRKVLAKAAPSTHMTHSGHRAGRNPAAPSIVGRVELFLREWRHQ
jgi:hypothetical protein